jgi:hypothetical protein
MTALLNDPVAPPSQSTMHAVARHHDALQDYARDFQRARVRCTFARNCVNLELTFAPD